MPSTRTATPSSSTSAASPGSGSPLASRRSALTARRKSWSTGARRTRAGSGSRRAGLSGSMCTTSRTRRCRKRSLMGCLNVGANEGWVSAGDDHDTAGQRRVVALVVTALLADCLRPRPCAATPSPRRIPPWTSLTGHEAHGLGKHRPPKAGSRIQSRWGLARTTGAHDEALGLTPAPPARRAWFASDFAVIHQTAPRPYSVRCRATARHAVQTHPFQRTAPRR